MAHPRTVYWDKRILREGSQEEVENYLDTLTEPLDEESALLLLSNPNCNWTNIQAIEKSASLMARHAVQVQLVRHRTTPSAVALKLIPLLYWKELLETALDVRVLPLIRRNCEKHLRERLFSMGLGEKISLARRAPAGLINDLRADKHLKVIRALLENPRITLNHVLVIANSGATPPEILAHLAQTPRWANQPRIRMALIKNDQTPLGLALGFLSSLKRTDLTGISRNPAVNPAIRIAARRILERER